MNFNLLKPYLDEQGIFFVQKWMETYRLKLKIVGDRKSKLGDYSKIQQNKMHQITINGNLNKFAFLFVLTHEIAHMHVFNIYNFRDVLPHGKEWKNAFSSLLQESVSAYPSDIQKYILKHSKKPRASVSADPYIVKFILNKNQDGQLFLENINDGDLFYHNYQPYIKGKKRRTRYECLNMNNHKKYLIHHIAVVEKG